MADTKKKAPQSGNSEGANTLFGLQGYDNTKEQISQAMWKLDAENILIHIKTGVNALDAIHAAMEEGCSNPACYIDGLWYIQQTLVEKVDLLYGLMFHRKEIEK